MRACLVLKSAIFAAFISIFVPRVSLATTQVVLIQPDPGDAVLRAALFRLRGELTAVGFEVQTGPGPDHNPRWELEQASTAATMVTITLRRSEDDQGVDVWVLDRLSGKTLIRHINVPLDAPNAPTLLAVRTTELLRASLLEVTVEPPVNTTPRPAPMPSVVTRWMTAPRRPLLADWSVDLRIAVIASPGVGVNALPQMALGRGIFRGFAIRIDAAATVVPSTIHGSVGDATLDQLMLGFDLVYVLFADRFISGLVAIGAGAYHLRLAGRASVAPYVGITSDRWAAFARAGLGVSVRLSARLAITLQGFAFASAPAERVSIADESTGTIGSPSFIGSLGAVLLL